MRPKIRIGELEFEVMIPAEQIAESIKNLAKRINEDYRNKQPLLVVTLKGAIIFAADLARELDIDCEIEAVRAKSYGGGLETSGRVNLALSDLNIEGRDVIIIEDIVDTGLTLQSIYETLLPNRPASLEAATLLSKPAMRQVSVPVKYIGLEIEPKFVVGFGLDYMEKGRNLPCIYSLIETLS
ncbi:MAG: hypoxanthine phosphoribosyltransferase [Chloroflexota bacterium]